MHKVNCQIKILRANVRINSCKKYLRLRKSLSNLTIIHFNPNKSGSVMNKKICLPLLDIENILPILNKISIFGGLSDRHLYQIFRLLQTTEYKMGEIIFRKGDMPSHIYIVRKGRIELLLEGKRYAIERAIFEIGQCFGEAAVIGIQPHTATAIAIEKSELLVLSRQALLSVFDCDKELFGLLILNIARETSRRLNKTDEILLHYLGD